MTDEDIVKWKAARDIARGISNPEDKRKALEGVYDLRDDMMMNCIAHQSSRTKEIQSRQGEIHEKVEGIEKRIVPLEKHKKEADENKLKLDGVKIALSLLKYGGGILVSFGGGFYAAVKFFAH